MLPHSAQNGLQARHEGVEIMIARHACQTSLRSQRCSTVSRTCRQNCVVPGSAASAAGDDPCRAVPGLINKGWQDIASVLFTAHTVAAGSRHVSLLARKYFLSPLLSLSLLAHLHSCCSTHLGVQTTSPVSTCSTDNLSLKCLRAMQNPTERTLYIVAVVSTTATTQQSISGWLPAQSSCARAEGTLNGCIRLLPSTSW